MTQDIAQKLRRPLWLPSVPASILRRILGERSALVLDSHWVIPEILLNADFEFKYPKFRQAIADLLS
jgi:NAD dependent epimerase/dehydratase family enzyme